MIVVKIGGGEGNDVDAAVADLAALHRAGERVVLVHGGSARTNEVAEKLGHPPQFVKSESGYTSRRSDPETMRIFQMVYCGEINSAIVAALQRAGVNAVGLSGLDGGLLRGPRKKALRVVRNGRRMILRDDFTGTVEQVNSDLLQHLLDAGYLPVISPPALSYEGEAINVDGDRAAAAIAAALGAKQLLLLTGVPGLLRDFPDPASLVPRLALHEIDGAIEEWAEGRMRLKLVAAREALQQTVDKVIIGGSTGDTPVRTALAGNGTIVTRDVERQGR